MALGKKISIKHDEKEYYIKEILSFSIQNPIDSLIEMIDTNVFNGSHINSLTIPSQVTNLKPGWCCCTKFLNKVSVNPKNRQLTSINDKIILGKNA